MKTLQLASMVANGKDQSDNAQQQVRVKFFFGFWTAYPPTAQCTTYLKYTYTNIFVKKRCYYYSHLHRALSSKRKQPLQRSNKLFKHKFNNKKILTHKKNFLPHNSKHKHSNKLFNNSLNQQLLIIKRAIATITISKTILTIIILCH